MADSFQHRRRFVELVDDLRRHLGLEATPIPDATDDALTLPLQHRGVPMTLVHDGISSPEHYAIECDLEPVGAIGDDEARDLLALNFDCLRDGIGTIALCEDRGTVLLVRLAPLENSTVAELLDHLNLMAGMHAEWHDAAPDETPPFGEPAHALA